MRLRMLFAYAAGAAWVACAASFGLLHLLGRWPW
jgi:hypothetical protein